MLTDNMYTEQVFENAHTVIDFLHTQEQHLSLDH